MLSSIWYVQLPHASLYRSMFHSWCPGMFPPRMYETAQRIRGAVPMHYVLPKCLMQWGRALGPRILLFTGGKVQLPPPRLAPDTLSLGCALAPLLWFPLLSGLWFLITDDNCTLDAQSPQPATQGLSPRLTVLLNHFDIF
jgi:hypothetical protein